MRGRKRGVQMPQPVGQTPALPGASRVAFSRSAAILISATAAVTSSAASRRVANILAPRIQMRAPGMRPSGAAWHPYAVRRPSDSAQIPRPRQASPDSAGAPDCGAACRAARGMRSIHPSRPCGNHACPSRREAAPSFATTARHVASIPAACIWRSGEARRAVQPAGRPVKRRARSAGLPGHRD